MRRSVVLLLLALLGACGSVGGAVAPVYVGAPVCYGDDDSSPSCPDLGTCNEANETDDLACLTLGASRRCISQPTAPCVPGRNDCSSTGACVTGFRSFCPECTVDAACVDVTECGRTIPNEQCTPSADPEPPADEGLLLCEDVGARLAQAALFAREGRVRCVDDADCVLISPEVRCDSGVRLAECSIAVARDQATAAQQHIDEAGSGVCARLRADCSELPSCLAAAAKCNQGACVAEVDAPSDETPDAGPLSCEDAAGLFAAHTLAAHEGRDSCREDADCVLIAPEVSCANGVQLVECGVAVASDRAAEALQSVREAGEDLCTRTEPGCHASPSCLASTASCVDGACVAELDGGV